MTNQKTPLLFSLSDGRRISVDQAKSVLQISDRGTLRRCMVVRGSQGAAIYNAHGDVPINGAPSSSHWLKPGDQLEFSPSLTATVEQIGELQQAIVELELPVQPTSEPEAFKPATEADTFVPATDATTTAPEPMEPIAAALSRLTSTGALDSSENTITPVTQAPNVEPELADPANDSASPATGLAAELLKQIQAEEENEATGTPTPTHSPVAGGISLTPEAPEAQSAELSNVLQSLVALKNDPQPAAASEAEFQQPAVEDTVEPSESLGMIVPENKTQPDEEETAPANEPSESVAAMLERMKAEGQWNGLPDDEDPVAPVQEIPQPVPEPTPTPEQPAAVANECEDDVQSYMSQLLNRMRGDVAVETPSSTNQEVADESNQAEHEVSLEKAIAKLRPEEFVPKSKAKRVEGWQGMRELANSQVRNAIDKSQEKKRMKSVSTVQLGIGLASGVLAIYFWMGSSFGAMSASMAVACVICSGYAIYKAYVNVLEGHLPQVVAKCSMQLPNAKNVAPLLPAEQTTAANK